MRMPKGELMSTSPMTGLRTGTDTSVCETCRVYKKYGDNKPIKLKLRGKGIDADIMKKT